MTSLEIDAKSLQEKLGEVLILDVRNPPEVQADGAIAGSLFIPMGDIPRRVGEIPQDRPIVAVCSKGMRSYNVANWLRAQGRDAVSLAGGLSNWRALGLPLER